MCKGTELYEELKDRQVAPVLRCTTNTNCWCMNVSNEYAVDWHAECMSPAEMLTYADSAGVPITDKDRTYLKEISTYTFKRKNDD
jgi:hypothetical protein